MLPLAAGMIEGTSAPVTTDSAEKWFAVGDDAGRALRNCPPTNNRFPTRAVAATQALNHQSTSGVADGSAAMRTPLANSSAIPTIASARVFDIIVPSLLNLLNKCAT